MKRLVKRSYDAGQSGVLPAGFINGYEGIIENNKLKDETYFTNINRTWTIEQPIDYPEYSLQK